MKQRFSFKLYFIWIICFKPSDSAYIISVLHNVQKSIKNICISYNEQLMVNSDLPITVTSAGSKSTSLSNSQTISNRALVSLSSDNSCFIPLDTSCGTNASSNGLMLWVTDKLWRISTSLGSFRSALKDLWQNT